MASGSLGSRWAPLCGVTLATMATADRALGGAPGVGLLWAFGAGAGAGLLLGASTGGIARVFARRSRTVAALPWAVSTLAGAAVLLLDLGILSRLDGAYQALAWAALMACLALVGLGTLLGLALQPTSRNPTGWLLEQRPSLRLLAAFFLASTAAVCTALDRTVETDAYPVAHDGLRWASVLAAAAALFVLPGRVPRRVLLGLNLGLGLSFLGTLSLTRRAETELALLHGRPLSGLALRTVQKLGDPDLDDYSMLFGGGDCAPLDPAVNPGADEIPGNGIDDNCRRGDATARSVDARAIPVPNTPSPHSVVLITVDTLAARRMSLYGAKRKTTPNLARWAKDAIVFERAYASGAWTSLSIPSLFRGVYPRRLAWTRLIESNRMNLYRVGAPLPEGETMKTSFGMPLDEPREPVAWWLQQRGMFTAAVVCDRQSEFLDPSFVGRGFDTFIDLDDTAGSEANDADVTRAAKEFLDELPDDRPSFLWVHYFGPHKPDESHEGVPTFGDDAGARYDHEIAYNDRQVHRLLEAVERHPLTKDAVIVLTSDHAEQIRSSWRGHGGDVQEKSLHVPLVLKIPGAKPGRVSAPVSLVDVFPTILALTETPAPPHDGVDLRVVARGEAPSRALFAETWRFNARGVVVNDRIAAFDGRYKLEHDRQKETYSFVYQRLQQEPVSGKRGRKERARLRTALELYLEESGVIRMSD